MAANYWTSTQCRNWRFTKAALEDMRTSLDKDEAGLVQQYALPDWRLLSLFFNQLLSKLGRRMNVRQQALATAQVYVRRFYVKVEIRSTNPYLVVATALYLACKMEECPQHIRVVVSESRSLWPDFITTDVSKVGECEFYLISEMSCQMIVHHPYRTLSDLQQMLKLGEDEASLAWSIVNDHYLTDIPLLYPPHVMAVTAIFLALVLKPGQGAASASVVSASAISAAFQNQDIVLDDNGSLSGAQGKVRSLVDWLAKGEVDVKSMIECTQEIISLYEIWEQYNDKTCKERIARFVKARGFAK